MRLTNKHGQVLDLPDDTTSVKINALDEDAISFEGSELPGISLRGAMLLEFDFARANMEGACMDATVLTGSSFIETNLQYATFVNADLTFTNFVGADLQHANLTGAKFRSVLGGTAELTEADLREADLRGADLRYTNITDATLLSGCKYDDTTTWPDGFNVVEHINLESI